MLSSDACEKIDSKRSVLNVSNSKAHSPPAIFPQEIASRREFHNHLATEANSDSILNPFQTPERQKFVVVGNLPSLWSRQDTLKILERFGEIQRFEEILSSNSKRTLIVKYETTRAALHAIISLAMRGVGFNSKRLKIQFPHGEFLNHPMLEGTDSEECKEMRLNLQNILQPLFSNLRLLGIPMSHGEGSSRHLFVDIFYPAMVSLTLLLSAVYLLTAKTYEVFMDEDFDSTVILVTCGIFDLVCFGIHSHHCRQVVRSPSKVELISILQQTTGTRNGLTFVSQAIESECKKIIPRVLFFSVSLTVLVFKECHDIEWTLIDKIIIPISTFYAFGIALVTFTRIRLYSRVVESGFRTKVRDLLVGEAPTNQIKNYYILVSLLTQEAFAEEHPIMVWMTISLLFSTVFMAANMFNVVRVLDHVDDSLEIILGFALNILNQIWWFVTMYEGTQATNSFKDLLENLRGPLYVTESTEQPSQGFHPNHIDLDSYVPGIKVLGQVLDIGFLTLAARISISAVAIVALRVLLETI